MKVTKDDIFIFIERSIIMIMSWLSVLLVQETWEPRENHLSVASHWQTLSDNVVHLTLMKIRTHIISGNAHVEQELLTLPVFMVSDFVVGIFKMIYKSLGTSWSWSTRNLGWTGRVNSSCCTWADGTLKTWDEQVELAVPAPHGQMKH
jgi:hypothetical protein